MSSSKSGIVSVVAKEMVCRDRRHELKAEDVVDLTVGYESADMKMAVCTGGAMFFASNVALWSGRGLSSKCFVIFFQHFFSTSLS